MRFLPPKPPVHRPGEPREADYAAADGGIGSKNSGSPARYGWAREDGVLLN